MNAKRERAYAFGALAIMSLLAFGSLGDSSSSSHEPQPSWEQPAAPVPSARPIVNLADDINILSADAKWAPSKTNPGGMNLLWVQPQIQNHGNNEIAVIYADLLFYDANGTLVERVEREIIYYSTDVGKKLGPGQVYAADPVASGDPFALFAPDGMPVTGGNVRVECNVVGAYEDDNIGSKGQRLDI